MRPSVNLPDTIVTPQDIAALLLEIRRYNQWFQHERIKQRTGVNAPDPAPILSTSATSVLQSIAQNNQLTQEALENILAVLEHTKKTAPIITITLADLPTASIKTELALWCRENIAPTILVQFNYNHRILGGMVVRYGSRMFDWSFRSKLLANKAAIPEVLRHV